MSYISPFGEDQIYLDVYGKHHATGQLKIFTISISMRFFLLKRHTRYFERVVNCRMLSGYRFAGIFDQASKHMQALSMLSDLSKLRVN